MAACWKKKRFDKDTWNKRFAHLVEPTSDIAFFLAGHIDNLNEQTVATLRHVAEHFEATGEWLGLPCESCNHTVSIGQRGRGLCPHCGAKP